ncbi:MAG: GNAT family N-acetyltransferase [Thaumarchaeota archaeon]|nr:GNAT family N-acetyltransferase [Nitrososphaerota archaeon]
MKFKLTYARPDDLELLVAHRLKMWRDVRPEWAKKAQESEKATREWIRKKLSDGSLIGFVARAPDGEVAGSGCIWIREEQPRPTNPRQEFSYLMSMYTEKRFRHKGVAKMILRRALRWCRAHKYERVVLHASDDGRPLYEKFGFEPTREMLLRL